MEPFAAVVGGEENRAPAGQHIQRVQPVGGLVPEQPRRDAVELPQAEEGRDHEDQGQVQPGVGEKLAEVVSQRSYPLCDPVTV
ncbi:MAG: hypothetical protein AUK03_09500 [Anaerolineae bacterium CG2_30_64_16]|nr:MAG: hypothetical protein AUK03_09500 [Anaerolineae bacterium CG2_30_64_16]